MEPLHESVSASFRIKEAHPPSENVGRQHAISRAKTLGEAHYLGHDTLQNYARAFELFKQGVDKGDSVAMIDLGAMYANGYAVKKDVGKAQ